MRAASGQHDFCGQGAATTAWPHAVGVPASQAVFGGSHGALTFTRTRTFIGALTVGGHAPWMMQTPACSVRAVRLMKTFGKQGATDSFGAWAVSLRQAAL